MAKYTLTQGSKIEVTKEPAATANPLSASWLGLESIISELAYTGGAKTDIEVTTLGSTEKEQTNGLPDSGEIKLSGNWAVNDETIESLRKAYNDNEQRAFRVIFPDGSGYQFLGEVRQESFTASKDAIATGEFTIRMKGRLQAYTASGE